MNRPRFSVNNNKRCQEENAPANPKPSSGRKVARQHRDGRRMRAYKACFICRTNPPSEVWPIANHVRSKIVCLILSFVPAFSLRRLRRQLPPGGSQKIRGAVAHLPSDEKVHKKFAFNNNVGSEFLLELHRINARNRTCATAPYIMDMSQTVGAIIDRPR